MSTKLEIHMPTAEEDAVLTAAALSDQDNPPLTDAELAIVRNAGADAHPPPSRTYPSVCAWIRRFWPRSREAAPAGKRA